MATNLTLHTDEGDDYIDMELTASPQSTEFEFTCNTKVESTAFSADELFYEGKLLPLHLLHRAAAAASTTFNITKESLGAVEKEEENEEDVYYTMALPKCATAPCTNTANTPLDSANISPSESCRVSCELNRDDYFYEWSTELTGFIDNHSTKRTNWSKRLKLIKHTVLGHKLRAPRAYLRSLFGKSDDPGKNSGKDDSPGADECSHKYSRAMKRIPFGVMGRNLHPTIAAIIKDGGEQENVHRRSFSSAIKRHSPNKCLSSSSSNPSSGASSSSSSFSLNSNTLPELQFLRRSSSATEVESSIEAAIAHCKKSQQLYHSRNSSKDHGICLFSADAM